MTSVIVHEERELPGMQKAMKAKNASYLKRQSGFVYTLQPNMHGMASAIFGTLNKRSILVVNWINLFHIPVRVQTCNPYRFQIQTMLTFV